MTGTARTIAMTVILLDAITAAAQKDVMPDRPVPKQSAKPMPSRLSEGARSVLRSRMLWHAIDLQELIGSVIRLDFETARTVAKSIAADSGVTRSVEEEEKDLKSGLPDVFFTRQAELKLVSARLASSLARRDTAAISRGIGELTATCVRCHAELAPGLKEHR